jgi:hypothetical protein
MNQAYHFCSTAALDSNQTMEGQFQTKSSLDSSFYPQELSEKEYKTAAFYFRQGNVQLIGKEGSMINQTALSVTTLSEQTLPPLNQGMVNVTGDGNGYRMLPDGLRFREDIAIILPYDSTLLPMGYTPDDIVTYYYDVNYEQWIAIERDSVDVEAQLVYSKVNHFTDFINAVLKVPEMPETSAFAPTSIKELKAVNTMEGLSLIQPPTANNN